MTRILCILMLAIFLPCCALAESQLVLVSPTPSAQPVPVGVEFSCEAFFVTLPAGMEILSDAQMEGYTAAVQAAFPDFAPAQLAAVDLERNAALVFSLAPSALAPLDAAKEAASAILGSDESASEFSFGANLCAGFAFAAADTAYRVFYFSDGAQLLAITACGLTETEIAAMLSSLDF